MNDITTWTSYTFGNSISLTASDKCYFRAVSTNNSWSESFSNYIKFSIDGTKKCNLSGNVMSLLDNTCSSTTIPCNYCFYNLFNNANILTSPELPATTLANYCYGNMFANCSYLTTPPELPAITLANYCYDSMFVASGITTAPKLQATSLAIHCYYEMFYLCSSLTTAPELPATALADGCYGYMFNGCSSLQVYSSSGTGHTNTWVIPTSGSASGSYLTQRNPFKGTIGDYTSAESITFPVTVYTQNEPI